VICTQCGHENPSDARFCSSCGTSLIKQSDDATITFQAIDVGDQHLEEDLAAQTSALSPGDGMIYVKRGTNVGATYLLDNDLVRVGRHPDSEVFLDDVTVSRRHAEFRRDNGHFIVQDVGSLNGTYRNGERIETASLHHGDEVQIGKFKLLFLSRHADA
jgi:pSer/pThr/pTyr-binding forkhead associated (FHA) protein